MSRDYQRIEKLIHYLDHHSERQPELEDLARVVDLSPFHLQKLFKRWAGVSPKQYLKLATLKRAKQYLQGNASVLEASLQSGLSGSGRLHDHFVTIDAVTPGEFKSAGLHLELHYGLGEGPYGKMFVAWTRRGIHALRFANSDAQLLKELEKQWPRARFIQSLREAQNTLNHVFAEKRERELVLRPLGSNFQVQVWKALLTIPSGYCISYGELAKGLGKPGSARAVGSAVGANPIALLIPCHRVIQASGTIGDYRWGERTKRLVLAREHCLQSPDKLGQESEEVRTL